MINKIRFLGTDIKQSLTFLIIITIEIMVCISLLNYSFTSLDASLAYTSYYSKSVADFSYVTTYNTKFQDTNTVKEIKSTVNLSELATRLPLGDVVDIETDFIINRIEIMTPALRDKFNKLNIKRDLKKVEDYFEAYVLEIDGYEIGKVYTLNYMTESKELKQIKIKPVAYFDLNIPTVHYYFDNANPNFVVKSSESCILICDELINYDFVKVQSGILCNDNPPNFYRELGFNAKSVKEIYRNNKERDFDESIFLFYISGAAMLFTFVSIVCLYLINFHETSRKRTVNYICGLSRGKQFIYETIKMLVVILIAFIIDFIASFAFSAEVWRLVPLQSPKNAVIATGIVMVMYTIALLIGMLKHRKTNTVESINNEQ